MSLCRHWRLNSEKTIVIDVLNERAAVLFSKTGKQGPWYNFKRADDWQGLSDATVPGTGKAFG
jgi:hypothetical protein